jgi:retron-type reverse transcriptase
VISPLLANIALHGMESLIKEKFPENKRKRFWTPLVVRYADGTPVQASN